MDAHNRPLIEWLALVETGQLKLPRFQRFEAWDHSAVTALIETVLRGLPAGAALTLHVGDSEPFISRHLVTAPERNERVTEHLLDGQQRLTALWRALHGTYPDRSIFIRWEEDDEHGGGEMPVVVSQARWTRKDTRYPVWCDEPEDVIARGLVPVTLLAPGAADAASSWLDRALGDDFAAIREWERRVSTVRQQVASYNIPYLALPVTTPKDVALEVFVKMNTSNVRLSAFDIVVAQLEAATGASLHDLLDDLKAAVPPAEAYHDLGSLVLDVAALRDNRSPTQVSYQRLDTTQVKNDWAAIIDSIRFAVDVLEQERVFDAARLSDEGRPPGYRSPASAPPSSR